jgi:hypothetical protein
MKTKINVTDYSEAVLIQVYGYACIAKEQTKNKRTP